MNENELYDSLSKGKSQVYFLYGEERYSIEKAIQFAKESLNPNFRDLNFTVIDEDNDVDIDNVVSCCESVPFLDDKRIILIKNTDLFLAGNKNYKKEQIEKLSLYLKSPSQTTILIFAPSQVDKSNVLFKTISSKYAVFKSDRLNKIQFKNWVTDKFNGKDVKIDNSTKDYFIEKSGYLLKDSPVTLLDVENEIDKIVQICKEKNKVRKQDIDYISLDIRDNNIFKFIDAVFMGDNAVAYAMMDSVIDSQKSPVNILSLLGRHISILLKINILKKEKNSVDAMSKMLGLAPFVIKKYVIQLKSYSYKELMELYNLCSDMDCRVKKGQIKDAIGVEVMINRIVNAKQKF